MHAPTARRPQLTGEHVLAGVIFLVATVGVAALGNVATSGGMDWYDGLDKPGFTPPEATFGIVWSVLYAAIAVAGWLAWRASAAARPTVLWAVQMVLNLGWTIAFFGFQSPIAGIVVIALLLAAVAAEITVTAPVSTTAAALLVPYFVWCTFAAALTVGVAVLN